MGNTVVRACKHYESDYVNSDGDSYGSCALDQSIIDSLPANWCWYPRERSMPDAWDESINCKRYQENTPLARMDEVIK